MEVLNLPAVTKLQLVVQGSHARVLVFFHFSLLLTRSGFGGFIYKLVTLHSVNCTAIWIMSLFVSERPLTPVSVVFAELAHFYSEHRIAKRKTQTSLWALRLELHLIPTNM